jgi:predicted AAA+ superfamily ATPase
MKRIYGAMLARHLETYRQMAFVAGPRQVGKTFLCRSLLRDRTNYLNWDNLDDRELILKGPAAIAGRLGLQNLSASKKVAVLDELHKFSKWKSLLKGFFDTYENELKILVTGSSRLDIHRRGGDSLMGRYFLYRMHPFSVAELLATEIPDSKRMTRPPKEIAEADFAALLEHGGFPEPFINRDPAFTSRWWGLRLHQLVNEDMRDTTRVNELGQLEVMAKILQSRSACQLNYSSLASDVKVSVDTARRWIDILSMMQFGFLLRPWHKNITNSLRKEPKWFLRDWSGISEPGPRFETMVACHLLKAVDGWNDLGFGEIGLFYLRDKMKREVDFLVVRDGSPWFLAEAKKSNGSLSPSLLHFMKITGAPHAFQIVLDREYVNSDCFATKGRPLVVPARTLLSQLL